MDRRTFVKASCLGSAGLFLGFDPNAPGQENVTLPEPPPIEVHGLPQVKQSPLGMPGLFPGRVVELSDPKSIVRNRVSQPIVGRMIEQGMKELTGERSLRAAWSRFVEPTDVVGIKINPSGAPACCSSPEIVREIISGVQSVGVPARNIIVYDRYAYEIDIGSYQVLLPPGVRVVGIQDGFVDAAGYDPIVYCEANFFGEWETRSYMASIVAHTLTKIIKRTNHEGPTPSVFRITYQSGDLKRSRTKVGGGSYLSWHDPRIVLGIGKRTKIDWLEIKWPQPGGTVERFTELPIDRYITVVEGQGKWR